MPNIQQDPNDPGFATGDPSSLVSGFRRVGGPFAQQLDDGLDTFLYSVDSYFFEANITGLPFQVGEEFVGTDDVEHRLRLGNTIDPTTDPVIGLALAGGVVRITSIVPEPSSVLWLLGCGLLPVFRRSGKLRSSKGILVLLALAGLGLKGEPAVGQVPTQFELDVQPVYTLILFDGTPVNMTGMDLTLPLNALGDMEFMFANNDINDPLSTSADFSNVVGEFAGQLPDGTPFDLRTFQFISGGLTNIQRDIRI